jgi:HAD superfamily hydrolase (TIGR01509 family)
MIDALIFDFDGVIIDTETPAYQTWQEVFNAHGVRLDRSLWQRIIGGGAARFDAHEHLEDLAGARLDRDAIRRSQRERYLSLVQSNPLLPGVLDYIKEARRLGLKLGVASSSTRAWVEEQLEERDLLPYFHCVVTRDDVTSVKPDPELFVVAMKRLGTSPHRAVAIEDSLNGVTAARRAGMFCVAVPNPMTSDMDLGDADLRLGALSEMALQTLLDALQREGPPTSGLRRS